MATQPQSTQAQDTELIDDLNEFYRNYYRDAIGELAQNYPSERSLAIDYDDIYTFDPIIADDYLEDPGQMREYFEEALRLYDLPVDISLANAHVRVHNLPPAYQQYPAEMSPTEDAPHYRTVRGDVLVTTDTYSKIEVAAFECQRCGTLTRIPQTDGDYQEPHECQGCERQGPFRTNREQSEFVDGQTIQLQTPPERATGTGRTIQVFVEDDLCGEVGMGDRIAVSGQVRLNQKTQGNRKTGKFEPYLEGHHIEIEEATQADIDVDPDTRDRVKELAAGDEGDPLTVAAESFAPQVYGYTTEKKALLLALVGGATNTPDIRGEFHVLLIGDPSTSKSLLVRRANDIAARSLAVSAKQSSSAGLTSTATQGEFSDGRWTLSPGAFVKANEGVVTIDELDDMSPEDRSSMLEPMSNQQINVSKAGINATLSTQTSVIAAANPKGSRFDPYEPLDQQFGFESNLISRFDLVFTFQDNPDEDDDADIAAHTTRYRDAKVRQARGMDVPDDQADVIETPVDEETLKVWLMLAKRQPDPVYESAAVRETLEQKFVTLRGLNGYDEDSEVPVTFRKLPGVERIARASAKLEFSPIITERHAKQAMELVGTSLQDYQTTADGTYDADITESGRSQAQRDRMTTVVDAIQTLQERGDSRHAERDNVVEQVQQDLPDVASGEIHGAMDKLLEQGDAIHPEQGQIRYIGRS
jgi:replicative DNA helicase Mcm